MGREVPSGERPAWPWPDSLDALIAAPQYHKLLFENERVRVLGDANSRERTTE